MSKVSPVKIMKIIISSSKTPLLEWIDCSKFDQITFWDNLTVFFPHMTSNCSNMSKVLHVEILKSLFLHTKRLFLKLTVIPFDWKTFPTISLANSTGNWFWIIWFADLSIDWFDQYSQFDGFLSFFFLSIFRQLQQHAKSFTGQNSERRSCGTSKPASYDGRNTIRSWHRLWSRYQLTKIRIIVIRLVCYQLCNWRELKLI